MMNETNKNPALEPGLEHMVARRIAWRAAVEDEPVEAPESIPADATWDPEDMDWDPAAE